MKDRIRFVWLLPTVRLRLVTNEFVRFLLRKNFVFVWMVWLVVAYAYIIICSFSELVLLECVCFSSRRPKCGQNKK